MWWKGCEAIGHVAFIVIESEEEVLGKGDRRRDGKRELETHTEAEIVSKETRAGTIMSRLLFKPFHSVQDPSPWNDVTHISSLVEPLWEQSYSRPDQTRVPFLGDSKSC